MSCSRLVGIELAQPTHKQLFQVHVWRYLMRVFSVLLLLLLSGCVVGPDTPPPDDWCSKGNSVFIDDEEDYEDDYDDE